MTKQAEARAKIDSARKAALDVLRGMLDGSMPLIEGCRTLVSLRFNANIPPSEAFIVFIAVESETDDCPLGSVRNGYAPELLARSDAKIARILERDGPIIIDACRDVIREIESLQLHSCEGNIQ